MSEHFIRTFQRTHQCANCLHHKLKIGGKTYSMCKTHLDAARQKWADRSIKRRTAGLCCYCNRKSLNGYLRCRKHTEINKNNCKKWMKLNYKEYDAKQNIRKEAFIARGLCPQCKPHRPLTGDRRRCAICNLASRLAA